jgi:hypothetical protein
MIEGGELKIGVLEFLDIAKAVGFRRERALRFLVNQCSPLPAAGVAAVRAQPGARLVVGLDVGVPALS